MNSKCVDKLTAKERQIRLSDTLKRMGIFYADADPEWKANDLLWLMGKLNSAFGITVHLNISDKCYCRMSFDNSDFSEYCCLSLQKAVVVCAIQLLSKIEAKRSSK